MCQLFFALLLPFYRYHFQATRQKTRHRDNLLGGCGVVFRIREQWKIIRPTLSGAVTRKWDLDIEHFVRFILIHKYLSVGTIFLFLSLPLFFFQLQNKCENLSRTIYLTSSCSPLLPFLVVIPHRSYCRHRRAVHTNRSSNWTRLVCCYCTFPHGECEKTTRSDGMRTRKILRDQTLNCWMLDLLSCEPVERKRVEMWKFNHFSQTWTRSFICVVIFYQLLSLTFLGFFRMCSKTESSFGFTFRHVWCCVSARISLPQSPQPIS